MVYRLLFTCFLVSSVAFGQESLSDSTERRSGIIFGDGHAFYLTAPKGWVLDKSSGVNQGLFVVFYPAGGSWKTSSAVMYAYTVSNNSTNSESSQRLINSDIAQYKQRCPTIRITKSPEIQTKDKKTALVRLYFYSNYESVAYIDEKQITVVLVLTARAEKNFSESFPAFQELVRSYSFLPSEVQVRR